MPSSDEDPCVFQVGDSGGLHHDPPSALSQSEAVHREYRGPGSGGQGAGPGETFFVYFDFDLVSFVSTQYRFSWFSFLFQLT